MKKLLGVAVLAIVLPFLGGCAEAIMLGGQAAAQMGAVVGARVGENAASPTPSSVATSTIQLASATSGETFVEHTNQIADKTGFQVVHLTGTGLKGRVVILRKRESSGVVTLNYWVRTSTVTLRLEESGAIIQIDANVRGGEEKPDAARELIKQFKREFGQFYVSKT